MVDYLPPDAQSPEPRVDDILNVAVGEKLEYKLYSGKGLDLLGAQGDVAVQERLVKLNHGIPGPFPDKALRQAETLPEAPGEADFAGRKDLRDMLNRAGQDLLGYSQEEIATRPVEELLVPDDPLADFMHADDFTFARFDRLCASFCGCFDSSDVANHNSRDKGVANLLHRACEFDVCCFEHGEQNRIATFNAIGRLELIEKPSRKDRE